MMSDMETQKVTSKDEIDQLQTLIETKKLSRKKHKSQVDDMTDTWHHLEKTDLLLDNEQILTNIKKYENIIAKLKINDDPIILTQQKAVLSDKVKTLGTTIPLMAYYDGIEEDLIHLKQTVVNKPPFDQVHYNEQLDSIKKWRHTHKTILSLIPSRVLAKITEVTDTLQQLNNKSLLLIDNKPNQPEITPSDHNKFFSLVKQINHSISQLDDSFNTTDSLRSYCQTHPLPTITSHKNLAQLQQELSIALSKVENSRWKTMSLTELGKLLTSTQSEFETCAADLDKLCSQKDQLEQTMAELLKEFEEINVTINKIGSLNEPYISENVVDKWLENFEQKRKTVDHMNQKLTILNHKLIQDRQIFNQYIEHEQKIELITRELNEIMQQNLPFNSKCAACRMQPWKVRQLQLANDKQKLSDWLSKQVKPTDLDKTSQSIQELTEWIDQYNQDYKSLDLYQKMKTDWSKHTITTEQLSILRHQQAGKQTILTASKEQQTKNLKKYKLLETDKRVLQASITELHYIINNKPTWDNIQQQIDDLSTYQKIVHIHKIHQSYMDLDFVYYEKQKKLLDMTEQWKIDIDVIKQQIIEQNKLLDELRHKLLLIQENEKQTVIETDCLQNIELCHKHYNHCQQLLRFEKCVYSHNICEIDEKLTQIAKTSKFSDKLEYWKDISENKPLFEKKQAITKKIERLYHEISEMSIDFEKRKTLYDINQTKILRIEQYNSILDTIKIKYDAIDLLHKLMSNFRVWLYSNIIIPQITKNINEITSIVTDCNDFSLQGSVTIRNNTIKFNWSINSPSGISTIEKSGGFRKYIYGLIMRISLSRMGCSRINNTQLVIDEGFTSADIHNLDKMQIFLSNLTDFFPNGIIIASHLQTIKDCGDITVQIDKNITGTSCVKFGPETLWTDNVSVTGDITHKNLILIKKHTDTIESKPKIKITTKKLIPIKKSKGILIKIQHQKITDECIALLKNGMKCGKPTKFAQPYCGHHIKIDDLM
jgi:hypothetical protein